MSLRWRVAQFFEMQWWKRYLAGKEKPHYLAWKKNYWRTFLGTSAIEVTHDARVLDAGCGPAGIFTILDTQTVDALDPLLEKYQAVLPHFNPADYPKVRFISQALEDYSPEQPYDIVFCLNAINHVADLPRCLDRLVALTRPNGILAVSIDAHNYKWIKRLFQIIPGDILHPHQYDLPAYQEMLVVRGCTIKRTVLLKKEGIFSYYLLVATRAGI